MTARLHYWYLAHPGLGRPALVLATLQGLFMVTVATAPRASASTNAGMLNWTGLKDGYGVPIGDYYLAIASIPEQITQAGPHLDWNPASWAQWSLHAATVTAGYVTTASIMTGEAGAFIGIIALALWLMKITVSTYWLTVIGEIARAVTAAVIQVTTQLGLLLVTIPVGVFAGVMTIRRGEAGRGWTMIGVALTMPALSVAVFADPAGEMYGPNGLLAFGRRIGFSVAEAARPGGALTGAGFTGQVDTLTASLITHTVREPLQLWNFGHVVDRVGGCAAAWSGSVRQGAPDGPIRAMATCGDRAAVSYAEHLDGTNVWIGAVFVTAALLLALFMVMSGWAVLKVSVKAIWTTAILLPTLWLGGIPGAPQRRAMTVVWQFFRHGIEVTVYIVYVSVIGLAVERIVSQPLPAELGGANPFPHVLMMGGVSIAAFVLLHHIKADLSGHPATRGVIGRATDVAIGMGMHAATGWAGSAAISAGRGLTRRSRHTGLTPWEQIDQAADKPREVLGDPRPGFNPVPDAADRLDAEAARAASARPAGRQAPAEGQGTAGERPGPHGPAAGVPPLHEQPGEHPKSSTAAHRRQAGRRQGGPARSPRAGVDDHGVAVDADAPAGTAGGQTPSVPPITELPATGYSGDPPPPEPPPEDEPPPPDDGPPGPPPTTVNPITET
ncbi:hypothetical protein [Mycobacterium branderi]|uniref:Uncharacterized protein n=1 Tax=Mycobacterium branderi TaxID=43348 RepID=A0A7I7WEN1_9MYCO|nr:hypothetical protein [Mycobacterium branderi]MCV7231825.1 hypothetical protein [Mycobacterium branderi]ORA40223.1 hypothetical protein BST20_06585 [Mycobacterium branderi]BBZ15520.1 hypothetical protein MBRA_57150 [Mycobacterium branderi]